MKQQEFTSAEAARICGVSLRQLQWWDEKDVVSPRQEGHRRWYRSEEVVALLVVAELRRRGVPLQRVRSAAHYLQRGMGSQLAAVLAGESAYLLTDGRQVHYIERTHAAIVARLQTARKPLFMVCVSDCAARLSQHAPESARTRRDDARHVSTRRKPRSQHASYKCVSAVS